MFDIEYAPSKPEKLPTLKQWLKALPKKYTNRHFHVTIVWVPGNFDNYTLVTSKFRIIVTPRDALFQPLKDYFDNESNHSQAIGIEITSDQEATYKIFKGQHNGKYETFYGNNWKWIPTQNKQDKQMETTA